MTTTRYLRNREAISEDEQTLLGGKRVLVVGCGGLGGMAIECLARLGVGNLRIVDGDFFEESNLNRQLLCSPLNLGKPKTLAAEQRVRAVNPLVRMEALQTDLSSENAAELLVGCDVAIDCLDNIPARMLLQEAAKTAGIPLVHAAVAGWMGRVCVVQPGQDILNRLYPRLAEIQGEEQNMGTLAFTASLVASWQAAEAVKILLGKPCLSGEIIEIDLLQAKIQKIKLM